MTKKTVSPEILRRRELVKKFHDPQFSNLKLAFYCRDNEITADDWRPQYNGEWWASVGIGTSYYLEEDLPESYDSWDWEGDHPIERNLLRDAAANGAAGIDRIPEFFLEEFKMEDWLYTPEHDDKYRFRDKWEPRKERSPLGQVFLKGALLKAPPEILKQVPSAIFQYLVLQAVTSYTNKGPWEHEKNREELNLSLKSVFNDAVWQGREAAYAEFKQALPLAEIRDLYEEKLFGIVKNHESVMKIIGKEVLPALPDDYGMPLIEPPPSPREDYYGAMHLSVRSPKDVKEHLNGFYAEEDSWAKLHSFLNSIKKLTHELPALAASYTPSNE